MRWAHLVLGGALLMPYWLLASVLLAPLVPGGGMIGGALAPQLAAYALALPMAAVTAVFPLTRPMSVAAARALCGVPAERFAEGPARSRSAKARTAGWFTLHLGAGGLVSGASLALPPFAVATMAVPFSRSLRESALSVLYGLDARWLVHLGVPAGLLMLLALAAAAAGAGALLARQAPLLLGPTPADRLAAAERRAADLAARNRLARELHDSVGHALSAVTLQAGAARRVLGTGEPDLAFVREALTAIEETTRRTVGELDSVLGMLRQGEDEGELPGPGLEALGGLLAHSGVRVDCERADDTAVLPEPVSREAYRIVQEGLSNALRHGRSGAPVALRLRTTDDELEITMENPLPGDEGRASASVVRPGGGRGLRGVAERAALLGGRSAAGPAPDGAAWRVSVRLPLRPVGGGR
ncbi:histidine kinase [Streptomyces sp. MUM 203J]|uniref:sensor histidine kinase n=1 Tax=Streptomyces sp. MUM 203J TaxID=2791990 RepID=UPI001F0400A4|nr:histidine kinase [Streptomyces sp. MUM 203J]MCH0539591.1 histidine kinase [Streptomyces sp. MUM 203J]